MPDHRERAKKLIELALNSGANEHEARNAALKACRLIKEHGLLGAPTPQLDPLFGPDFGRRPPSGWTRPWADTPGEPVEPPPQPRVEGTGREEEEEEEEGRLCSPPESMLCAHCKEKLWSGSTAWFWNNTYWHPSCYRTGRGE